MAVNRVPPELLEEIFILQILDSEDLSGRDREPRSIREMRNSMLVCKSWLGPATRILYRVVHLPMSDISRLEKSLESLSIFGMHVREFHSLIPTVQQWVAATYALRDEQYLDKTLEALANCPNTRSVTISYYRPSGPTQLESLLACLETLNNLDCFDLSLAPGVLSSDYVYQLLRRLRNLKDLTCDFVTPRTAATHPSFHSRNLQVATLNVARVGNDFLFELMSLFHGVPVLQLKFAQCPPVTKYGISRALVPIAESVEELLLDWRPEAWDQTGEARYPLQDSLPAFIRLKKLQMICFDESFFDAGALRLLPTTLCLFKTRIDALTSAELASWLSIRQPFAADLTLDFHLDRTTFGDEAELRALCTDRGYTCDLRCQQYSRHLYLHLVIPSTELDVPSNP